MWHNYFFNIQKKYDMRIKFDSPLVIRMDGKNVTKNKEINLIDDFSDSFLSSFKESAKYFSEKYNCYSILGSDEISFIIEEPQKLINDFNSDNSNYSQEIASLFAQYFYNFFNSSYRGNNVYFHTKCFSISKDKIKSYIKYRSKNIENVLVTYFLKRFKSNDRNLNLNESIEKAKTINGHENLLNIKDGFLYHNGINIDLFKFINEDKKEKIKEDVDEIEFDF